MNGEKTISELIDSINNSLDELSEEPEKDGKAKDLPTDFEILMSGINGESGLSNLFSPQVDKMIGKLFDMVIYGDFDSILANEGTIKAITDTIFGPGSFEGPIPTRILNSVQNTMMSYKYSTMKSKFGKAMTAMKKLNMILKNLNKEKRNIKNAEELKKYKEAVYAIKQVLKVAAKVYSSRKYVNQRVISGLNTFVHDK